ncbi:DUF4136 domain-containing protein [Ekhidna sp. To15]|uniref:DUF4136 domain-containing protein n=1 Tax=Ekhidna sp. To15 TaxID=3395267 RepID=UPI003F521D29
MKKWFFLTFVIIASCNPKVVSYVNSKANFSQFETYRLVTTKAESKTFTPENTLIFDLIKKSIRMEMDKRDYIVSNVSPDLTLRYEVTASTRFETNSNQVGPYYAPQVNTRTIYESVLLMELYDSKKKLVWQGSYDLRQQKKEKKASKAIEKGVGHIFTSYPYRAKSAKIDEALKTIENKKKDN